MAEGSVVSAPRSQRVSQDETHGAPLPATCEYDTREAWMGIFDLTVRDLMGDDVTTVRADSTVADLMALLEEKEVTGVPVTGPDGQVVGVVSTTDVARAAATEAATGEPPSRRAREKGRERASGFFRLPDLAPLHLPSGLPRSSLGARAVRDIMTPATFSVRPDASIGNLAGFLARGGIHRALVFEGSKLVGVVTAMDVVRAVAEAGAEE